MRRLLIATCLMMMTATGFAQTQKNELGRKKVGLVLAGGGAKGAAHVGVIKVLEKAGIPIDIVTGTSIGSIVGGLYSVGYDSEMLDSVFRNVDWGYVLRDRLAHRNVSLDERENQSIYFFDHKIWLNKSANQYAGGYIKGINVDRMLNHLITGYNDSIDFNTLPRPFACVAFNLMKNEERVMHSGSLAKAIRASMAIPGVFSPVRQDSMVLVDGGVSNNLPVDVAKAMGADVIIAVTLQDENKKDTEFNSLRDIVLQSVFVASNKRLQECLKMADLHINVNTHGYDTQSFTNKAIDSLIVRGENTGLRFWDELMKLKQIIGVEKDSHPQYLLYDKSQLYQEKQKGLEWMKPDPAINIGFTARFDLEEQAALQAHAEYKSNHKLYPGVDLTLRLGLRTKVKLEGFLEPWKFKRISLAYEYQHNEIYMYNRGYQSDAVVNNTHAVELKLFQFDIRNFQIYLGASWKYYHLSDLLTSEHSYNVFNETNTHYFTYNARLHYNTEDNWYFTTRGARLELAYKYFSDNLVKWKDHVGFSILAGLWRITLPITRTTHLQPHVFGRVITGSDIPVWERNMMGGNRYGIYSEHQIPFAGFTYAEFMENKLFGAGFRLQQRLGNIGYILLKGHVADHGDKFSDLLKGKPIWGTQVAYYYNSLIGPIGGYVSWSNYTNGIVAGVNIGYEF